MDLNLSQKERMLLEDDKQLEEVCVIKYQNYSNQAIDPELKELFINLSNEEQHHFNMIDQMLQGKQPDMSHSQSKPNESGQSQSSSSQSGQGESSPEWSSQDQSNQESNANWANLSDISQGLSKISQTAASQSNTDQQSFINNATDKNLCSDLLATEKYISSTYNTGVFESANPTIRQALQQIQKEEQRHGEQLFNYMHSHGMYNVK